MAQPVNRSALHPSAVLADKNILLSGTTGFLGKVVLSLLLSRYPEIRRVYALIRPGVSERARDRFNKTVATSPALRPLVEEHGGDIAAFLEDKVVPVDGDITKPNCGISDADLQMLDEAGLDLFINSAGLVDFDPPVDSALNINAIGADNIVALARRLDAALVHVSTCFVAGRRSGQVLEDEPILDCVPKGHEERAADFEHRREIERLAALARDVRERAEDPVQKAQWRIDAAARLEADGRDPGDAQVLRSAVLRQRKAWVNKELRRVGMERAQFWGWTNTYTFTKSLGEQVIAAAAQQGLNACIVRPSVVESSLHFPFPGWNEGMTTSAPLVLLTRAGLRSFPYAEDLVLDVVPVDMVAGVILAAGMAVLAGPHKLVYQAATGDVNPMSVRQAIELTGFCAREYAESHNRKGLAHWMLSHQETRPVTQKRFNQLSAPRFRQVAGGVRRLVDGVGPDRFGWMRQPAGVVRQLAADIEKGSARAETILELFMPFIAENAYVFRCDNTRHLMSRIDAADRAGLHFEPEAILWRDYWRKIHTPGLERWVFPKLEADLAEKPKRAYTYRSLVELFESATHTHRHRVAFHYLRKSADEHLTYGELRTLARRVAGFLVAQGVAADDRVLLVCENRPEWVAAYFGILLAGATAVPVDAQAKATEIINIATAAEARGVILSPRTGRRLVFEGAEPQQIAASGAALWLLPDAVCYPEPLTEKRSPARLASVIFTSGTTGKPKGVMLSHRNFTFEVSRLAEIFNLAENDHLLSVLPLHHTFEFTAGLLMPLSRGARITYVSQLNGETLGRAFKQGVSGLIGVPALWQLLKRRIESQLDDAGLAARLAIDGLAAVNRFLREYFDVNLGPWAAYPVHRALGGRLKYLVSGGSAISPEVLDFFRGLGFNLTEGYGLTETAPVVTVTDPKLKLIAGSVGKPLPGIDVRINEPNDDGIGEVWVRGPNVMQGYFGDRDATDAVLEQGWLRTGDLGRVDDAGRLYLAGRQKDVIVDADGRNVYPDELEDLYGDHPRIKELSVVGLPQPGGVERVACLVVPDYDGATDAREALRQSIRQHLRHISDGLAYYKRIKIVHFFDGELPRTATRKVKRPQVIAILQRLQAADATVSRAQTQHVEGSDATLTLVRQVLATLSGKPVGEIHAHTRLAADLGFDSLMYVELATGLEHYVRGDLSSEQLMAVETVADLVPLLKVAPQAVTRSETGVIGGRGRRADADGEGAYPIPAPMAKLGKRLLGWGQRQFYRRVMDIDVRGMGYLPRHTSFLVAANHSSHLDAGLVKIALGRYGRNLISLAAKDYFFSSKLRRTYFENFTNLMPIERQGALKQSLRRAVETLQSGRNLLIFPEGTRSENGAMQGFKPSLGYLMLAARVPVLPMYLWGTYEAMPKGSTLIPSARRIGCVLGPPILPEHVDALVDGRPKSEAYRLATQLIELAVVALREEGGYRPQELLRIIGERVAAAGEPGPAASDQTLEVPSPAVSAAALSMGAAGTERSAKANGNGNGNGNGTRAKLAPRERRGGGRHHATKDPLPAAEDTASEEVRP